MVTIFRLMKADFMKLKRTSFYWIHICMPLIGITLFFLYYSNSALNSESKVIMYFDALSLVFPTLIGIVCSIVIEQEFMAGRFKEMLSTEFGKGKILFSKIAILLFSGFLSLVLAIGGFFAAFQFILKENTMPLSFYIYETLIIFGCQISIYLFHLCISIFLGKGASIGIGIFESLCAALMVTGLGDGRWQVIPCAWSVRFSQYFLEICKNSGWALNELGEVSVGVKCSIVITIIVGIIFGVCYNFFEGRGEK